MWFFYTFSLFSCDFSHLIYIHVWFFSRDPFHMIYFHVICLFVHVTFHVILFYVIHLFSHVILFTRFIFFTCDSFHVICFSRDSFRMRYFLRDSYIFACNSFHTIHFSRDSFHVICLFSRDSFRMWFFFFTWFIRLNMWLFSKRFICFHVNISRVGRVVLFFHLSFLTYYSYDFYLNSLIIGYNM